MDLRYRQDGAPQQTTYTVKSTYGSDLSAATDLGAALFLPAALATTIIQKLVSWGF